MKKIMFSDRYGLTQAVIDGRKTMTRRIFAPREQYELEDLIAAYYYGNKHRPSWAPPLPYVPGEVVAVAQSYRDIYAESVRTHVIPHYSFADDHCDEAGWNNKMFVRADLMPHTIKITDLFFERLQDISAENCLREGVIRWLDGYIVTGIMEHGKNNVCFDTPCEAFASLIDRISRKGTWDSNPWTIAYSFSLIT